MSDDLPDDDLPLDTLADEAVAFACRHHPNGSPRFRRMIARLYIKTRLDRSTRTTAIFRQQVGAA